MHTRLVDVFIYMEKINHSPTVHDIEKSILDKLQILTWK